MYMLQNKVTKVHVLVLTCVSVALASLLRWENNIYHLSSGADFNSFTF